MLILPNTQSLTIWEFSQIGIMLLGRYAELEEVRLPGFPELPKPPRVMPVRPLYQVAHDGRSWNDSA